MARPKKAIPDYRFHFSGQAIVTLDGTDFYLGPHNSPESRAKYFALLGEYNANGMKAPQQQQHQVAAPVTVRCVTGEFREHIKKKYAKNANEKRRFENLCTLLEDEYGGDPVEKFGPRKLAELRELFVASGNCRRYVNDQTRNIIRIFQHGVSAEIVDPNTLVSLNSLEPLRYGQTEARESEPRQPVAIESVRATAKLLSPTIRTMVLVQAATGMRPSEVFNLRPRDIDRSGDVWIYIPEKHKNTWRGKKRVVPIIEEVRAALTPYLLRDTDAYCFSPRESAQWYREQRTANRKTNRRWGTKPGDKRKADPKRRPGVKFTKDSYRRAIKRKAEQANVEHWTPYQLRHLAASVVCEHLGLELTQSLLGHSHTAQTEHYVRVAQSKAIQAAKAAPKIS
ncbi:site-specific tyrosine recombinase XerC [Planctomycetes bacterium CA13]|uniref:Site-specific tyrosine recombinase XerC n=1 Tax=Novipirellula herctigrandis TaxID=2527986 RepID=A0A5C5YMV6_9BACT|nr:site-specific tyrosine recombinase XerC [Planctomycetes bacterium CA13]